MQYLRTLQVQDDGLQGGNGERVGQDLHGYYSKVTEGENIGKFQCNLCGKICNNKFSSFRHVEALHFPGSYEYECDQCCNKFDTKSKYEQHRSKMHSTKKSKSKVM